MRFRDKLTELEKEKLLEELIASGAIKRDTPLLPGDVEYSSSLGEKGKPILQIKI